MWNKTKADPATVHFFFFKSLMFVLRDTFQRVGLALVFFRRCYLCSGWGRRRGSGGGCKQEADYLLLEIRDVGQWTLAFCRVSAEPQADSLAPPHCACVTNSIWRAAVLGTACCLSGITLQGAVVQRSLVNKWTRAVFPLSLEMHKTKISP